MDKEYETTSSIEGINEHSLDDEMNDPEFKHEDSITNPRKSNRSNFRCLSALRSAVASYQAWKDPGDAKATEATEMQKGTSIWEVPQDSTSMAGHKQSYKPWGSKGEWEIVEWLCKTGVRQEHIKQFLSLELVCSDHVANLNIYV